MNKMILPIIFLALAVLTAACTTLDYEKPTINSFKACEVAGGNIAESYPRQCMIDGQTFVEDIEKPQHGDIVTLTIEPELVDCVGHTEQKCMVINGENYYNLLRGNFTYEEGYTYTIKAKVMGVEGGFQDFGYEFVELISKEKQSKIPENCVSWYDGCNTCGAADGELTMCTLRYCEEDDYEEAKCLKYADEENLETFFIGPELKECVGVGPQTCMVINGKYFYDQIEGFDYEEGYTYTIKVKKETRENVPADANAYTYTLVEMVAKEALEIHVCTEEEKASQICTREYRPVCGDDGMTYSNGCSACSSGFIDSWIEGEC